MKVLADLEYVYDLVTCQHSIRHEEWGKVAMYGRAYGTVDHCRLERSLLAPLLYVKYDGKRERNILHIYDFLFVEK